MLASEDLNLAPLNDSTKAGLSSDHVRLCGPPLSQKIKRYSSYHLDDDQSGRWGLWPLASPIEHHVIPD
jgi:hypothetical protein